MNKIFDNIYVQLLLVVLITPLIGVGIAFMDYDSEKTICKRQSNARGFEFYKYDNYSGICLVKYEGKVIDLNKIVYNISK